MKGIRNPDHSRALSKYVVHHYGDTQVIPIRFEVKQQQFYLEVITLDEVFTRAATISRLVIDELIDRKIIGNYFDN